MAKFPTPDDILDYINGFTAQGGDAPTRRDIAKAFKLKGPERATLRRLLSEMEDRGVIALSGKRAQAKGALPPVLVLDIVAADEEGDLICQPLSPDHQGEEEGPFPQILLPARTAGRHKPPLGVGHRFLARLTSGDDKSFTADVIKLLGKGRQRRLGVFRANARGGYVDPVERKGTSYNIDKGDVGEAKNGDLVWLEEKNRRGYGPRKARIVEVVGDVAASRNWSLIALAQQEIPIDFPAGLEQEAADQTLPDGTHHEDLRPLPLITIDPADAKDHDDAVYAQREDGGWSITVAIADVSWFIRPGTNLDKEALKRGNSVYLVDRVVPMLPEVLSNGLCSLKAGEDRPALCCEMHITDDGQKKSHRFFRAMIRCQAGICYEEVQNARDGHPNDRTRPLKEDIIDPLYEAYEALKRGQEKRSPLALEMPERTIKLTPRGEVEGVAIKERFDAHKLIEAMMVAANVCAAESLEKAKRPLIYRVHDIPNPERVDALAEYLEAMGYSLPKGQVLKPQAFNRILQKASEREETDLVSLAILRTQSQAIYDTNNLGHFGLNLSRYAHFTSPIRRYADLTVHRGLVAAYKLGPGGVRQEQEKDLSRIAELITATERRAVSAERATQDRFLAAYLEEKVGTSFPARISGVTSAGVFVALDETGADGFVPMRSLQDDYYLHDEPTNRLVGQHTGGFYALGQRVEVELLEVTPLQGGLRFNMQTAPLAGKTPAKRKRSFRNPSPRGSSTPLTGKPNRKSDNAPSRKTKDKGLTLKRRPKKRD